MPLNTHNCEYRTTVGSDVVRDGFFAELVCITNGEQRLLAEAFFNDGTSQFTFSANCKDIPFETIRHFVEEAGRRVPSKAE